MSRNLSLTAIVGVNCRTHSERVEVLGRLFHIYDDQLRKIISIRLGTELRGRLDSNDIMQETFIGAINSFDSFEFRSEAGVINWLSRIAESAITRAAKHFSAAKRRAERLPNDEQHSLERDTQIADYRRGPGSFAAAREEASIVEECVGELPPQYREIIVLRDYVGYGWEAIAKVHGRPSVDAARMMHAKARLELDKQVRGRMRMI
jgi:RNA polymerase sigma-70 factor (ECF subfamily)